MRLAAFSTRPRFVTTTTKALQIPFRIRSPSEPDHAHFRFAAGSGRRRGIRPDLDAVRCLQLSAPSSPGSIALGAINGPWLSATVYLA